MSSVSIFLIPLIVTADEFPPNKGGFFIRPKQPEVVLSMSEQNIIQPEMENQVENETLQNESSSESKQPETQKEDESAYAKQLEELRKRAEEAEEKVRKQEEIIENKNRDIERKKEKLKDIKEPDPDLEERLLKRLEERQTINSLASRVASISDDPNEQKLIMHYLQDASARGATAEETLKNAVALANRDILWEQRRNRALEERREDFLTSFAGTSLRGEGGAPKMKDPIMAQAEQLVRAVNPKAVDFLNKQS